MLFSLLFNASLCFLVFPLLPILRNCHCPAPSLYHDLLNPWTCLEETREEASGGTKSFYNQVAWCINSSPPCDSWFLQRLLCSVCAYGSTDNKTEHSQTARCKQCAITPGVKTHLNIWDNLTLMCWSVSQSLFLKHTHVCRQLCGALLCKQCKERTNASDWCC